MKANSRKTLGGLFASVACLYFSGAAFAQVQSIPDLRDIRVLEGHCGEETRVGIEENGSGVFERTPFDCDSAVVSFHESSGSLMIQFIKKGSDDNRIIGFAGTLDGRELLLVERVYLATGASALIPNDGHCKLFWKEKAVEGIVCGAQIDTDGLRVVPIVVFKSK